MNTKQVTSDHFFIELKDETGTGTTEVFRVFPGVYLMYNDFHLAKCRSGFTPPANFWGVEHCRDGKTEWELENGDYAYLGSGALMPCDYEESDGEFSFPSRLFEGLTIGFEMPVAEKTISELVDVNLTWLREKIMFAGIMDVSGDQQAEAVLRLLYIARHQNEIHRKISCIQFLLFLKELEPNQLEPLYIRRQMADKIKEIEIFLRENLDRRWTLMELSEKFRLPVSVIRRNFTGIFGVSVADHMRRIRVEKAKEMLVGTDKSIAEIAADLGYDNASKFSAAFRNYADVSPRMYRIQN